MSFSKIQRSNNANQNDNELWWRLPESQRGPHRRAFLEEQLTQQSIDKIILDYFIQEGFHSAAEALALEAGIPLEENVGGSKTTISKTAKLGFSTIVKRKEIKLLILEGNVIEAIRVIGKYFPTILDSQPLLLFSLLRLNLIEMIREHKSKKLGQDSKSEEEFLNSILDFVRENMINKVTYSASLLKDLETTMSLLCFDFDTSKPAAELTELPPKLRELFNKSLRKECYRKVNRAILELNDSTSAIHYSGAPLEFSPSKLQNLKESIAKKEDSETDNSDDEDPYLMNRELKIPHFPPSESEPLHLSEVKEIASEEGKRLDNSVPRSQLERMVMLWYFTQRKMEETVKKDKS